MSTSKRVITRKTLQAANWVSIFDTDKKKETLTFRDSYCFKITLTHRDLRAIPSCDPQEKDIVWDSSKMIPHFFDTAAMDCALGNLSRLSQRERAVTVQLTEYGGIGGNIHAREPLHDEWLRIVCLPMDSRTAEGNSRYLEIQWLRGRVDSIIDRFRLANAPRDIESQLPEFCWKLSSTNSIFTATGPFSVNVIECLCESQIENEHGVATAWYPREVLGLLENGIVLWCHHILPGEPGCIARQEDDCVMVDGAKINIFTGEGAFC